MTIKVPTRIDLCGGTLDIWPLSVIFAPALSINVAINLYASVSISKKKGGVTVHSKQFGKTLSYIKDKPEKDKNLFDRVLDFYSVTGLELTVETASPPGAGLGGSSSLAIALIRCLNRATGRKMQDDSLIRLAQDIEARHLGIPTGVQDYVAALNGGVNVVENGPFGQSFTSLKIPASELERRIVLAYSGKSRISGMANWIMIKKAIEGDKTTVRAFRAIAQNSLEVKTALVKKSYSKVGKLIDTESRWREKLGKSIVTPPLKKVFGAIRKKGGHPKVCGAGGGGCFMVWCDPDAREGVVEAIARAGMRTLDFKVAPRSK